MKIVAVGYTGTGSSAVVHLLKEYQNCKDIDSKNYEHNVFYVPHGLFDLEDVLLKNNSFYKSDAAINDFYKEMMNLYETDYYWFGGLKNRLGEKFKNNIDDFINSLVVYVRSGGWSYDYSFKFGLKNIPKDIMKLILGRKVNKFGCRVNTDGADKIVRYAFPTKDEFYSNAKKFVDGYFEALGYKKDEVYIFDQIIEPQQLYRINNYFDDDIKFIVVDRDPRDIFLRYKYIWSKTYNYFLMPPDAEKFQEFYRKMYSTEQYIEDPRVLRIHFEDLIYNYEDTVEIIENFVGKEVLGEHRYAKQMFVPEQSIQNTQLFNANNDWKEEVAPITNGLLHEKLYDFPYFYSPDVSKVTDPNPDTDKIKDSVDKLMK